MHFKHPFYFSFVVFQMFLNPSLQRSNNTFHPTFPLLAAILIGQTFPLLPLSPISSLISLNLTCISKVNMSSWGRWKIFLKLIFYDISSQLFPWTFQCIQHWWHNQDQWWKCFAAWKLLNLLFYQNYGEMSSWGPHAESCNTHWCLSTKSKFINLIINILCPSKDIISKNFKEFLTNCDRDNWDIATWEENLAWWTVIVAILQIYISRKDPQKPWNVLIHILTFHYTSLHHEM